MRSKNVCSAVENNIRLIPTKEMVFKKRLHKYTAHDWLCGKYRNIGLQVVAHLVHN